LIFGDRESLVDASFATEKRQAVFLDPTLEGLAAALSEALPGHPGDHFVDASQDGSRPPWAGSDIDPGGRYLFDKAAKQLSAVMPDPPELENFKLSPSSRSATRPPTSASASPARCSRG
jgi:hypothetical protein